MEWTPPPHAFPVELPDEADGRPRWRFGSKLVIVLLFLSIVGFAGGRGYSWLDQQVHVPPSDKSQPVKVHVEVGEPTEVIAADLQAKGLVRSKDVFLLYLRYSGANTKLQAGDFVLNRNMNMVQVVEALQHGKSSQITVRVQEGYTYKLMAGEAEKAGAGTAAEYVAAAEDVGSWQYDFLADRPAGAPANLEGYLFPDSYQLDSSAGARNLVKRQLDRFAETFTPELRAQAAQPTPARPAQSVFTIVVLASIVEREVNSDPDRARVCGIFYNRLARSMRLDADATVLYALGKWKQQLTADDLKIDSPYNTRRYAGLPPGPIANPGLAAIKACIAPEKTDYLFYFTDPQGVNHYARTDREFQQLQRQYGVALQ